MGLEASPTVGLLGDSDLWGLVCLQATAVSLPKHHQIMSVVLSCRVGH